ncbi:hypothetical protein H0H92_014159 [Tricholoma furcatifolium]|nr:hypothetical protein H0H92_014159 [Tricholoma furcatifolium]
MYFDDDLKNEYNALFNVWNPPPFLRILEDEEEYFRRTSAWSLRSSSLKPDWPDAYDQKLDVDPAEVAVKIDFIRFCRTKAFFRIVQGFFKGDLDLSGRHMPRYVDVGSKWNAYIDSFSTLSSYVTVSSIQAERPDTAETFLEYTFKDPTVWDGFAKKWKVPPAAGYGFLLQNSAETYEVILRHKVPKIQKLCLVHLPFEILESVFKHASRRQAGVLHSTCRRLYEIGKQHLVGHRTIVFGNPMIIDHLQYSSSLSTRRTEAFQQAALAARHDTLVFCSFLEGRPDLLQKLQSLTVVNEWSDPMYAEINSDNLFTALEGGMFFLPLFRAFGKVITPSVNLTKLSFSGLKLSLALITIIAGLPKLNHLQLLFCTVGKVACPALFQRTERTQSSSILNLEIQATNEESIWFTMLMCTNVINFTAHAVHMNQSLFPPPEPIWDKVRFFSNLRYLHLGHLSPHHLPTFWRWLQIASHGNLPALTHFKLEVENYLHDSEILSFLDVLGSAPLEVLSIDGALEASLDLFNWIAAHFPLLKGLTMIRRESTRQNSVRLFPKSFSWPVPSWEYARCLSAFPRLQHFGWNNHNFIPVYGTYSLRIWEEGHLYGDGWEGEKEADDDNLTPEESSNAVLFGMHCGTLTTFVNEALLHGQWRILRPSHGIVKAEFIPGAFSKWNPPIFDEEEAFRRASALSLRSPFKEKDDEIEEGVDLAKVKDKIDFIRLYRTKAFFGAVQGFHKRSLDVFSIWTAYVPSFLTLFNHMAVFSNLPECTLKDPTVWDEFAKKWKIPPLVDYGFLLRETAETLEVISRYKLPKIQELCLVDLPSEILDSVFKQASMRQARLLHSTCRRLCEIGKRHLVSHRKIAFRKSMKFYEDLENTSLNSNEVIKETSLAARDDTLAFCCFLEGRPDLLEKLDSLMIVNEWSDMFQTIITDNGPPALEVRDLISPLFYAFEKVMAPSVNLTKLTLSRFELPLSLILVISGLPQLNHLRLLFCTIDKIARRALFKGTEQTQSSSLLNLGIEATDEESIWFIMLMCPNVVNFTARTFFANQSLFPPPMRIWHKAVFFSKLKYLYLGHLAPHHLPTFSLWLRIASHGNMPSALTHFKVEVETYMHDSEILSFLEALRSPPLEVLSIEGALEAGLYLFNWIARHFPLLKGLTMIRRESTRQTCLRKPISWLIPSWEYARCFSAFPRLQHFEWNNRSFKPVYSTYSLHIWEEGGFDEDDWDAEKEADELDDFTPEESLDAVLFGMHCGTLTTFANEPHMRWRILRPSHGVVKAEYVPGTSSKWNPLIYGTWPVQSSVDDSEQAG